jgi:hypothetical protein
MLRRTAIARVQTSEYAEYITLRMRAEKWQRIFTRTKWSDVKLHILRRRIAWRIWYKYESHGQIQMYSSMAVVLGLIALVDSSPIMHYFRMPTEDINELMKDPYFRKMKSDREKRESSMLMRAADVEAIEKSGVVKHQKDVFTGTAK